MKINTKMYDKKRNIKTYSEIAKEINNKFNTTYTESAISKAFRGRSKSYKLHYLLCDNLELDIKDIYLMEE